MVVEYEDGFNHGCKYIDFQDKVLYFSLVGLILLFYFCQLSNFFQFGYPRTIYVNTQICSKKRQKLRL